MLDIFFLITTLLFLLFFYQGTGRNKRVLLVCILWMIIAGALAFSGFFLNTNTVPPRFSLILLGNLAFVIFMFKTLNTISELQSALIHTLRIPVEAILYFLFLRMQVPEIMTFTGLNFDILFGISALFLLLAIRFFNFRVSKIVLICWNFIGLLLLSNIVIIAILSAPLPIQKLAFDQPNIAVLNFPFVLLPSFIVPVVFITHVLAIKWLISGDAYSQ